MADNFGLKIGVEGEKEFKKALSDINQSFKVLGSEMKLVSSQFDKNDKSVQALSSRNQVLNKEIDAQKQKIETLKAALDNAATSFGENDKRTQNWQIQLNNAEAALNGPRLAEGPCIDLLLPVGQALHRQDVFSLQLIRLRNTGLGGLAVDQHRAGAAGALAASVLHRGQAQLVSQKPQQLLIFLSGYRFAVYRKNSHVGSPLQKVNLLFLELII